MQFVPIMTAIETMLSEADGTKDLIKAYRQFTEPEQGTWVTPLCVLCPDLDIEPGLAGYTPTLMRSKKISITVHFLERSYDVQNIHKAAVTAMDTLQHNACAVFEADPTLGGTVITSKVARIQLQRYNAEYFQFVITLTVDTKLE
jgi:hypothetical protein